MKLKYLSAISNQGPYLQVNEDIYGYDIDNKLFMILDGFGGAGVGDKAVLKIKEKVEKFYDDISSDLDSTLPFFYSSQYLLEANALINSVISSHRDLYEENLSKEYNQRAGASGIFATLSDTVLSIIQIGNCSCYLLREGAIHKLFVEDNFQYLGKGESLQNIPLSGIGLYSDLSYQVRELRIRESDKILFLTDGAFSKVNENELLHHFMNENIQGKEKIKDLFDLTNERGNLDNQTCLLLEY